MNPTTTLAIHLAEVIATNYKAVEIVDDKEGIILQEPGIPLSVVMYLLKICGAPMPDFQGWAVSVTDEKLKGNNRIRFLLANKILAAMKEQGITQVDLAQMTHKEPSHINRLLSGTNMTLNSLVMLQDCLNIKILDLS